MNENLKDKIQKYYLPIGEVFRYSLKIYISYFKYILILAITVFLPQLLLHYFVPDSIKYGWIDDYLSTGNADYIYKYILYALTSFAAFFPLTVGYIGFVTLRAIDIREITFSDLVENVYSKWFKFAICGTLYFIITVFSSLMLLFAIYFAVIFSFAPFYVVLHNKSGFYPLIQSRDLVRGKFWHIFAFLLMLMSSVWVLNAFISWIVVTYLANLTHLGLWIVQFLLLVLNSFFYIVFSIKFLNLISILTKQEY